jgi:predicted MPP superfamily phosphohydrolase
MLIPFIISIAVLLGLLLLLFHELRRSTGPRQWGRTPVWKKRIRVALAVIPLLLFSIACWAFFIEPNRLVMHEATIQLENWPQELNGLRVTVISDIHAGGPFIDEKKLRLIVERTNQLQPDLIVLLGDYMSPNSWHSERVEPEVIAAVLKDFHAPLGVYSVLGNHDWWYNGKKVRLALEQNGIKVLDDEVAEVKWRDGSFFLAGLADLWTRPQHINETIARVPPDKPVIALTHNPDIFPKIPRSVPLLLAGHTHGGQVNFPLIGRPIEPSDFGERYAAGQVFENGHHLFVTTGIGTSILPVRFRVPPEIVLLTIVR